MRTTGAPIIQPPLWRQRKRDTVASVPFASEGAISLD